MTPAMAKSHSPNDDACAFLVRHGYGDAKPVALHGDASERHYFRLPGTGLLLMEDRTDPRGFAAYVRVARHLDRVGLSAPKIEATDDDHQLALIEDWGRGTYANRLAAGASEEALYALAIDALVHLHHHPQGGDIALPRYDASLLLKELRDTFCAWFAPAIEPDVDHEHLSRGFLDLWAEALRPVVAPRPNLVLRDFHVDNLMELADRTGVRRCGLLDFQDAVLGCPEYDLVSLLQDARRDLAPGLEQEMLARYLSHAPSNAEGHAVIRARYYLLGAQRHTRIIGTFTRLCLRDGKCQYAKWLPRVLGQLDHALASARLHMIREFLDEQLPRWRTRGEALARRLAPTVK